MFEKTKRKSFRKRRNEGSDSEPPQSNQAKDGGAKPRLLTRIIRGWGPWHNLALVILLFLATLGTGIGKATWDRICLGDRCPSIAQITVWEPDQSSKLYAADGSLVHEFFVQRRFQRLFPGFGHGLVHQQGGRPKEFQLFCGRSAIG